MMPANQPETKWIESWSVVAATLVGAALRLYQLGSASLWLDEAYTYFFVTGPFINGWRALLDIGNHPPFFYLIDRVSASFTHSEFGLRLPAALAGLLAIPAIYRFVRAWGNRQAAPLAAWLLALNPFTLWYARDARPNTLNLFLVILMAWLFAKLYRHFTWSRWIGFVILCGLSYLTHYFSTLFALACACFLIARLKRDYLFFRWWTLSQFAAVVLISPWFIFWILHPVHSLGIGWIPQPRLIDLPLTLFNLATGWDEHLTLSVASAGAVWGLGIILALHTGLPLSRREVQRRERGAGGEVQWLGLTLTWLVVPIIAIFLFSFRRPLYVDRYFIVLLPPLILLAVMGLTALPNSWRIGLSLALLASQLITSLALITSNTYAKEDWRSAATFLRERRQASEQVLLLDQQDLLPLAYYGLKIQSVTQVTQPLPDSFWTVVRDPRESAHRFSEYDDAIIPSEVSQWLTDNHYTLSQQKLFSGLQLIYLIHLKP